MSPLDAPRAHRRAILFMIVAAICWSSGGILVRQLSITNAWEIVFWRSVFMALFVAGVLLAMHGRADAAGRARRRQARARCPGLFLAGTFFFFIASLTRTTVANTFVLMSVSPFLAALAGRLMLREPVPARTWLAMAVAFARHRRDVRRLARRRAPRRQPAGARRVVLLRRAGHRAAQATTPPSTCCRR